ncbi:unnamed protein product [Trichogramma brassicae]|uniref:Uncharacterized protein n=1 Tax=Trichogramma brassicae TaxID=86971 RepID=A0A6H5ISC5_9HYME|nr:unnamed protein product [Trichogramma brassicae]
MRDSRKNTIFMFFKVLPNISEIFPSNETNQFSQIFQRSFRAMKLIRFSQIFQRSFRAMKLISMYFCADRAGHSAVLFVRAIGMHIRIISAEVYRARADTSILNGFGETLLYLAVELDKYDIVELLLRNGADPDEADNLYQRTALSIACLKEYQRAVINAKDCHSPLQVAVSEFNYNLVKLFCDYNADFKNLHFQWQPIDLDDRQADQEVLNVFRIINFMEDDMELKDHLDILNFFIPIYKDFDFIDFNNLLEIVGYTTSVDSKVARADEKPRFLTTLTHRFALWCLGSNVTICRVCCMSTATQHLGSDHHARKSLSHPGKSRIMIKADGIEEIKSAAIEKFKLAREQSYKKIRMDCKTACEARRDEIPNSIAAILSVIIYFSETDTLLYKITNYACTHVLIDRAYIRRAGRMRACVYTYAIRPEGAVVAAAEPACARCAERIYTPIHI